MELELIKLIYDYSVKMKLFDLNLAEKIIEIFVSKKDLRNYVKNLRITDRLQMLDSDIVCASYSPSTKEVSIDYKALQIILENRSVYECLFSSFEQIMFKNFLITQILLHELEHANQHKILNMNPHDSIEKKLLSASLFYQIPKNEKTIEMIASGELTKDNIVTYMSDMYAKYYVFDPSERLAQIKSFEIIVSAVEQIKQYVPNLHEFESASVMQEMLKGYQESFDCGQRCPTEAFLHYTGQEKILSELDFYSDNRKNDDDYSLQKRLTYGLPISFGEYERTDNWLKSTNKFNV